MKKVMIVKEEIIKIKIIFLMDWDVNDSCKV